MYLNSSEGDDTLFYKTYFQSIDLIERLDTLFESSNCNIPHMCLEGEMKIMYQNVSEHQLNLIKKIYIKIIEIRKEV